MAVAPTCAQKFAASEAADAVRDQKIAALEAGGGGSLPDLSISPSAGLTVSANAQEDVFLFAINGVPANVTPFIYPNDGRFKVAGDGTVGWRVVTGATARSAGEINFVVRAFDAVSVSGKLTVTAAVSAAAFTLAQVSSVAENGSVVFTVTTPAATSAASVTLAVSAAPGSAGSAADWQGGAYPTTVLDFPAGTTVKTFTGYPFDDADQEGAEAFRATLSNPTGGATIVAGQIQFDIIDNDTATNITSPSAYSVPANSARFIWPSASTAGTWSKGAGGNAASFTTPNATTGIYSPVSNLAAGTYVMPLVFTPSGGSAITQNVTFTVTANVAEGQQTIAITRDFPGTAGTLLSTYSGWTAAGDPDFIADGSPVLLGDGSIRFKQAQRDQQSAGNRWSILNEIGDARGATIEIDHYNTRDDTGRIFELSILAIDEANRVVVKWSKQFGSATELRTSVQFNVFVIKNGVRTQVYDGGGDGFVGNADDFVLCLETSADGNTLKMRPSTNTVAMHTADISTSVKGGTKLGFANWKDQYDSPREGCRIRTIKLKKGNNTLEPVTSPAAVMGNRAVFLLKWTGSKPGAIDHSFAPVGTSNWSEWLTGDQTIADNGEIIYAATYPDNVKRRTRFRQRNDSAVITEALGPISPLAPGARVFSQFENTSPANYFQYNNPAIAKYELYSQASPSYLNIPGFIGGGRFIITASTAFTITGGQSNGTRVWDGADVGHGFSNIAQINATTWEVDIALNSNANRGLLYTGDPIGATWTLRAKGATSEIIPGFESRADGDGQRLLDHTGPNSANMLSTTFVYPEVERILNGSEWQGQADSSTPNIIKRLNALRAARSTFRKYDLAINMVSDDTYYQAVANAYATDLHPSIVIKLEGANETNGFPLYDGVGSGTQQWLLRDAFTRGGWGPNGNEAAYTNINWGGGAFIPLSSSTPSTTVAMQAGERIVYGIPDYSVCMLKAKKAVPAGSPIAPNEFFDIEFTFAQLTEVMERAYARKFLRIINFFKAAFGSSYAARVKPALMSIAAEDLRHQHRLRDLVPAMYAEIKVVGRPLYVLDNTNPDGTKFDNTAASITKEQIAANMRYDLCKRTAPQVTSFVAAAIAEGFELSAYEGDWHGDVVRAGAGSNAYNLAYFDLALSQLGADLSSDIVKVLMSIWPGDFGDFTDFGRFWGKRQYHTSPLTYPRYTGQAAGRAVMLAA